MDGFGFACFETRILNSSGRKLVLSMFGTELDDGAVYVVPGDVSGYLSGKFPGIKGQRMIRKLRELVEEGVLSITLLPSAPCGTIGSSSALI